MKKIIPIMFAFDNNYVIPAAVAFYSLLEHADKDFEYVLYVLHSDITEDNRQKLTETVKPFSKFSKLEFIYMNHRFGELWETTNSKGHFSKEMIYKISVASIFPQYEKIIVSDVDVVFLNDISSSYTEFDVKDDYYLGGVKAVGKIMHYMNNYRPAFNDEEIKKLSSFCAGYVVFNLKKLREDNMEEKFIDYFKKNSHRINQPEQDVLNLCCYPKTKPLHLKYVACSYMWDYYKEDSDFDNDSSYSKKELKEAMLNPVQLHYATSVKPWKNVDCTKSEEWFKYIVKTPFLKDYLVNLPKNIVILKTNNFNKYRLLNRIRYYILSGIYYVRKNPSFLIKASFYKKVFNKFITRFSKLLSIVK